MKCPVCGHEIFADEIGYWCEECHWNRRREEVPFDSEIEAKHKANQPYDDDSEEEKAAWREADPLAIDGDLEEWRQRAINATNHRRLDNAEMRRVLKHMIDAVIEELNVLRAALDSKPEE